MSIKILQDFIKEFGDKYIDKKFKTLKMYKRIKQI